ncbi:MAG: hypothetical protein RIS70_1065 [Planctomycetota bacterium]
MCGVIALVISGCTSLRTPAPELYTASTPVPPTVSDRSTAAPNAPGTAYPTTNPTKSPSPGTTPVPAAAPSAGRTTYGNTAPGAAAGNTAPADAESEFVIRGQNPGPYGPQPGTGSPPPAYGGSSYGGGSTPLNNGSNTGANGGYNGGAAAPGYGTGIPPANPYSTPANGTAPGGMLAQQPPGPQLDMLNPNGNAAGAAQPFDPFGTQGAELPENWADLQPIVTETQTGRFSIGVGVNSDAGVTGQLVIDERNFDWQRLPRNFDEVIDGRAFRGAGQGFRLEAAPGNQVQRYMIQFTEPYLFGYSPVSFQASAFFYNRRFFDWSEQRMGGRFGLGYRLTSDLSLSGSLRLEDVVISNPRVVGVPELDSAVGDHGLYGAKVTLVHDTRDIPFFPTEGHYIELSYEQVFGSYDYPRGEIDYRKYYLIRERPDGSGRHTLGFSFRVGASGSQTPIFENYFSGGFSTMRGFDFRGASPVNGGVIVGGQFRFLGSVEYYFPITADDMVKGVFFCDYGTTEREVEIIGSNFRVAPGFGLRFNIPAMGPAPLAFDFAVPVTHAPTDNIQNFSFFFGISR